MQNAKKYFDILYQTFSRNVVLGMEGSAHNINIKYNT